MPNESALLLVNSLGKTGIGEVGLKLWRKLILTPEIQPSYVETEPNWRSFLSNWKKILLFEGLVIVNLGFTSYGNSSIRNFLNFFLIGITSRLARGKLRLILHDSPAITDPDTSGYKHFTILKFGGTLATIGIRPLKVLVFSSQIYRILKEKYNFQQVQLLPFPCFSGPRSLAADKMTNAKVIVLHIGYIAPYKGLEILPPVKNLCQNIEFGVTDTWHRVLTKTAVGTEYFAKLRSQFLASGINLYSYLDESALDELCSNNKIVGILPYAFTSGSSSAALSLVERGVPTVCSDLPDFNFIKENGAGVVTVEREPKAFADAITQILSDNSLYEDLVKKNRDYCLRNDISNTIDFLVNS